MAREAAYQAGLTALRLLTVKVGQANYQDAIGELEVADLVVALAAINDVSSRALQTIRELQAEAGR